MSDSFNGEDYRANSWREKGLFLKKL